MSSQSCARDEFCRMIGADYEGPVEWLISGCQHKEVGLKKKKHTLSCVSRRRFVSSSWLIFFLSFSSSSSTATISMEPSGLYLLNSILARSSSFFTLLSSCKCAVRGLGAENDNSRNWAYHFQAVVFLLDLDMVMDLLLMVLMTSKFSILKDEFIDALVQLLTAKSGILRILELRGRITWSFSCWRNSNFFSIWATKLLMWATSSCACLSAWRRL